MSELAMLTQAEAPLAHHIRTLVERSRDRRPAAWPAAGFEHSMVRAQYDRIFGSEPSQLDVFATVPLDDTELVEAMTAAQDLAARAFGASRSFFITCGTTMANQIAFDVAVGHGRRVLLDRTAHQSLHCAAMRTSCDLAYTPVLVDTEYPGSVIPDTEAILDMVRAAHDEGRPFDVVALCASSYDGITYDLPRFLLACLDRSPNLTFLIDEAWSAVNNFHSDLRRHTALAAAEFLTAVVGAPPPMLVTHSAHKSMAAARQGSYLHVVGGEELIARVTDAVEAHRPGAVNLPILVSLDLARAHAEADGKYLLDRALENAERFRAALRHDPALGRYGILEFGTAQPGAFRYLVADPLKIMVETTRLGLSSEEVKSILFRDYDVYISRNIGSGFLVSFTIGITSADRGRLCRALASVARRAGMLARGEARPGAELIGLDRPSLLIAYPPGVPISLPGEFDSGQVRQRVEFYRAAGADIYSIPAHR